jgi:hypothetical protein
MDAALARAEAMSGGSTNHSAERRHNMSAAVLKRKLRNFPVADLTLRVLGS